MKKSGRLKTIIIVILLACIAVGLLGYFSNGFKDWSFNKKPGIEVPPTGNTKEIVSRTIVNEKYGTFELPVNSMLLSSTYNNIVFRDSTDLNYIWDAALEKAKNNKNVEFTEESKLVFTYDSYHKITEEVLEGIAKDNINGYYYFIPNNKIVKYIITGENAQYRDFYPIFVYDSMNLAVTIPNHSNVLEPVDFKFYCDVIVCDSQELNIDINFLGVIISDKGCPLTDYIYDEIMADSNTQITYNYAE